MAQLYRFLTGPEDATFCNRVSEALEKGWSLYGGPSLTFDPVRGRMMCGQAVVKEVPDGTWVPDMKLSEQ